VVSEVVTSEVEESVLPSMELSVVPLSATDWSGVPLSTVDETQ
jgi:hypothetical protein